MKTLFLMLSLLLMVTHVSAEGPKFSEYINKVWTEEPKSKVLKIAQQRLEKNKNDIVGLLLKLEYEKQYILLYSRT